MTKSLQILTTEPPCYVLLVHLTMHEPLPNRGICVCVNGYDSDFHLINSDVPHGFVLAPTLFLLSSTFTLIYRYADDCTLHASIHTRR